MMRKPAGIATNLEENRKKKTGNSKKKREENVGKKIKIKWHSIWNLPSEKRIASKYF